MCLRPAGTLELFEADLTIDGSFDEAVKGSHYVFHVASPVPSPKVSDAVHVDVTVANT